METNTLPAKPRIRVPAGRQIMAAVPEVETSYAAASFGAKDMATWGGFRVSPNSALLPELDTIVARSDDLARNNPIAAGAERTLLDNVVGPRVLCKPNPDRVALKREAAWADGWSREVESLWQSFADTIWCDASLRLTFHGLTRLVFRTLVSAGECLALPLWLTNRGSRWNTAIQLVDPARLSNPNLRTDTATLRGGIEIDQYGAPVAYHIRKSHPGDFFGSFLTSGQWERIPAYMDFGRVRVLHLFEPERIGQSRGKPAITSGARQLKMLDHFHREKLRLAVLNAMIFAALETPVDQQTLAEMLGGDAGKDFYSSIQEWRVQMRGGAIIPTPPGTKLSPFMPTSDAGDLDAFSTIMARLVGLSYGTPYELIMKDFSKTNYSSARAALLEAWRFFMACRQMLSDGWSSVIFELWFEEAVNKGDIPDCTPKDFYGQRLAWTRCKWVFAGRGWVDPVKEAQAAQIRMDAGLSTLEAESAEQGRDWRDDLDQQAREQAYREEIGLSAAPAAPANVVPATDQPPLPGEQPMAAAA
jgi:lambda family phage portal protein